MHILKLSLKFLFIYGIWKPVKTIFLKKLREPYNTLTYLFLLFVATSLFNLFNKQASIELFFPNPTFFIICCFNKQKLLDLSNSKTLQMQKNFEFINR